MRSSHLIRKATEEWRAKSGNLISHSEIEFSCGEISYLVFKFAFLEFALLAFSDFLNAFFRMLLEASFQEDSS